MILVGVNVVGAEVGCTLVGGVVISVVGAAVVGGVVSSVQN